MEANIGLNEDERQDETRQDKNDSTVPPGVTRSCAAARGG